MENACPSEESSFGILKGIYLHSQLVFKFRQSPLIKSLTEKSVPNLYIILTAMLFNRFIHIDHANRIVFFEYPVKPEGIFHFEELILNDIYGGCGVA